MTGIGNELVVATRNTGKAGEFALAFAQLGTSVKSLADYPDLPDIEETGVTFAENARIKAETAGRALGIPVLADDSGLEVEALDGRPGVYSARYAGEGAGDAANNAKLLAELANAPGDLQADDWIEALAGVPEGVHVRSRARFVCALALFDPATGEFTEAEGAVEGFIVSRALGAGGFGYDPLFWLPAFGQTMAQLSAEEKQAISHRGQALEQLLEVLGAG